MPVFSFLSFYLNGKPGMYVCSLWVLFDNMILVEFLNFSQSCIGSLQSREYWLTSCIQYCTTCKRMLICWTTNRTSVLIIPPKSNPLQFTTSFTFSSFCSLSSIRWTKQGGFVQVWWFWGDLLGVKIERFNGGVLVLPFSFVGGVEWEEYKNFLLVIDKFSFPQNFVMKFK